MRFIVTAIALLSAAPALGQIVQYTASSQFPEESGWVRNSFCTPERFLENGFFVQIVEPFECNPDFGDRDSYRMDIPFLAGASSFFVEFRVMATGPQMEMGFVAPATLSAGSNGSTNYSVIVSRDLVDFTRDNTIPTIFVEIEPDLMHTYRIEHIGTKLYRFLIDGKVIDSGVPEGPYPIASSAIVWRSFCSQAPNTTTWDYVVFGTLESEAVPATSQWGLAVMALLTLTAATLVFRSRPRRQAA